MIKLLKKIKQKIKPGKKKQAAPVKKQRLKTRKRYA